MGQTEIESNLLLGKGVKSKLIEIPIKNKAFAAPTNTKPKWGKLHAIGNPICQ